MQAAAWIESPDQTRHHLLETTLSASPEAVFRMLVTPRAIRAWWGATQVVTAPKENGFWSAAWGEEEDDPDRAMTATVSVYDPPRTLLLSDQRYYAKSGPIPFNAELYTEFSVRLHKEGSALRVIQGGFPEAPEADEFSAACEQGWREMLSGIERYVTTNPDEAGRAHGHGLRLTVEPESDAQIEEGVNAQILAFNERIRGESGRSKVALFLSNGKNRIVGGLQGEIRWGFMYVDALWADDGHREMDGRLRLLAEAEEHARRLECTDSILISASQKAQALYEKLGYEVYDSPKAYPTGCHAFFLRKRLIAGKQKAA